MPVVGVVQDVSQARLLHRDVNIYAKRMGQRPRAAEAQEITLLTKLDPARQTRTLSPIAASKALNTPPKKRNSHHKSSGLSIAVMTLIIPGLFATVALPAYASTPYASPTSSAERANSVLTAYVQDNAQTVRVDATAVKDTKASRDRISATTEAQL